MAMTIARAPSTPAAHSSARWPDENVRRGGGAGRWTPVLALALAAVAGAGARPVRSAAARACAADGTAAGVARPMDGAWFGPRRPTAGPHRGHGVGERTARAVPVARILHQGDLDELANVGRQIRGQRGRGLLDVLHRHRQGAVSDEGPLTRNRFVANNSQRVDIAGRGGVVAERLLRRDVLGGAHHHAGLRDRRRVDGLGDAEVGELHLAGGRDQDVAGFDVPVDQPGGVCDLKRAAGLLEHVERVPQRQAAGAFDAPSSVARR